MTVPLFVSAVPAPVTSDDDTDSLSLPIAHAGRNLPKALPASILLCKAVATTPAIDFSRRLADAVAESESLSRP
jgi:hypothetical protein